MQAKGLFKPLFSQTGDSGKPGKKNIMIMLLAVLALLVTPVMLSAETCCDAALIVREQLTVESNAKLFGDTLAPIVELRPDAQLLTNIEVKNEITLRDRASVQGILYAGGDVIQQNQVSIASLVYDNSLYVPTIPTEAFPVIEGHFEVFNDQLVTIAPGSFGDSIFRARSVVSLRSGTYNFKSLNIEPDANINFDTSAGPIRINVAANATLGSRGQYQKIGANEILFYGSSDIFIQPDVYWPGSIATPNGKLSIESRVTILGAAGAREVYIFPNSEVNILGSGLLCTINDIESNNNPFDVYVIAPDIDPFGTKPTEADGSIDYSKNNYLDGTDADDEIYGGDGKDVLRGGEGNDYLYGQLGDDTLAGGNGDDYLDAFDGNSQLSGGPGNDTLIVDHGKPIMSGGSGNDIMYGGTGSNWFTGDTGNDVAYGNIGNDTYVYEPGDGNDIFNAGAGNDILGIDKVIDIEGWNITLSGGTVEPLKNFLTYRALSNSISGIITAPNGQTITFSDVEDILINYPVYESGRSVVYELPNDYIPWNSMVATISGLPKSVIIKEGGEPRLNADGTYFQMLDMVTVNKGMVTLDIQPGYFGELNLVYTIYHGDPNSPQSLNIPISQYIAPTDEAALFAQTGGFGIDVAGGASSQGLVPLDVVINPLLGDDVRINISGLPAGVQLLRPDGSVIIADGDCAVLTKADLVALSIKLNGYAASFELEVTIEGLAAGRGVRADDTVYVSVVNSYLGDNGATIVPFAGNRNDYSVTRVGNALEIAPLTAPEAVTRVDMVGVDYLRFGDSFVASKDYSTEVNLRDNPAMAAFLDSADGLNPNTLILLSNLPAGAAPNNSIPVGEGVYAIPVKDILADTINIDHSTSVFDVGSDVQVSAYVATEGQMEALNGAARLSGYANAELFAEAGFESSMTVGPDGVRLGARAYAGASVVASAGGSIDVAGLGSAQGTVNAEAYVQAEINGTVVIDGDEISVQAYAGAEASASLSAEGEVKLAAIPGTSASAEGAVGASAYAYAGGDGGLHYGDGEYGGEGNIDLGAGVSATAAYYAEGQIAGIGANGGGGVKAGAAVNFGVGGEFGYDNGTLTLGFQGEIQLLLGVEIDLSINIDFNEIADAVEVIADGVIDALVAVGEGLLTGLEAVGGGVLDVGVALYNGVVTGVDAVAHEFVKLGEAAIAGFISFEQAVEAGFVTTYEAFEDAAVTVWNAGSDFLSGVAGLGVDIWTGVGSVLGDGWELVEDGWRKVKDAAKDVWDWITPW